MLKISALNRHFGKGSTIVKVLDGAEAEFKPGRLTVVAGPSGSGKTTLLSVLAGFETADSGTIELFGARLNGVPGWHEAAFVPQSLVLPEELTVWENIEIAAQLAGRRDGWDTDELMARLEIVHLADRLPEQISGGEQQRTALARALRLRPKLLLADEPSGHQDVARIKIVVNILRDHARDGNVVVISSHDEDVIDAADDVFHIAGGRLTRVRGGVFGPLS